MNKLNPDAVARAMNARVMQAAKTAPIETCLRCGSKYFKQAMMLKKVSGLEIGETKDILVPFPVFLCIECGNLLGQPVEVKDEQT
jgi:hypothetical protein